MGHPRSARGGKVHPNAPSAPPVELYAAPFPPHNAAPPPYRMGNAPLPPLPHGGPGPSRPSLSSLPNYPPPGFPHDLNGIHFIENEKAEEDIYSDISDGEQPPEPSGNRAARFSPRTFDPRKGRKRRKRNPMYYTKRGCTDVACCFLFLLFVVGWAIVAVLAFMWGNPERLIHPTDSLGRRCGVARNGYDLTDKPYLFFFDITRCISYATLLSGCQTPQMCVRDCPQNYYSYLQMQGLSGMDFQQKLHENIICADDVNYATITDIGVLRDLVRQQKCASYTVKSAPVLGRCIPQAIIGAGDALNNLQKANGTLDTIISQFGDDGGTVPADHILNDAGPAVGDLVISESVLTKIAADISRSWWQMLAMIIAAGILSFIWTVVMRIFGSLMIWSSIGLIVVGLSAGCAYCWFKWKTLHDAGAIDDFTFQPMFTLYFEMPTTWMVFAIAASVLLIIVLLILTCVGSRIRLGVAMIEESSKAIGNMMSTLMFPLFPFTLHVLVFALWGTIAIWLASSGVENCRIQGQTVNQTMLNPECDCRSIATEKQCVFVNVTTNGDRIFWLQAYNLFAFFWMTCFVTALGDIALAGAFASHYWAREKSKDLPSFPVLRSLKLAVKYNLGSLAFGSLIVALVKFIRVILDYLEKKSSTTQNVALKWIFTCLKCCFWCMEVFFKFLTKNAYIMMAIYGRNFFSSAKDSFLLLARNCIRVVVINKVTAFLLFIGKATITIGMGVVAFFWFSGKWVIDGIPRVDLYYYFVPIVIVLIGSYFVADMFFDVYEMAVDTTFICFLEDSEQNDGSVEKPFFMSPGLLKILGKKNEMHMYDRHSAGQ